jgi:hypothetical protein
MFSRLIRGVLAATALAPVLFVVAFVAWHDRIPSLAVTSIGFALLLVALGLGVMGLSKRVLARFPFRPKTIEVSDKENMGFVLFYLAPLFSSKLTSFNLDVLVPTGLLLLVLTAAGYSYHYNPLLALFGWHFYKVSSDEGVGYVLLSRRQLRSAVLIEEVGQLTEYILLDLG